MLARHKAGLLDAGAISCVAQPIDCRRHLSFPAAEPYFGNVIYMTQFNLPFSALADPENALSAAARALRAEINLMSAARFRDLLGYAERTALEAHTRLT